MIRKHSKLILVAMVSMAMGWTAAAIADQPHMRSALSALQTARAELNAATSNKGGHRERAIDLVERAISQTRDGMAYAGN
jgi:hypothetical protein